MAAIGSMMELRRLDLTKSLVVSFELGPLEGLILLRELVLHRSILHGGSFFDYLGDQLECFYGLKELRHISMTMPMHECQDAAVPCEFLEAAHKKLKKLTSLVVGVEDETITPSLLKMKRLTSLTTKSRSPLPAHFYKAIARLPALQHLSTEAEGFECLESISRMKKLQSLSIKSHDCITARQATILANMTGLQELKLDFCDFDRVGVDILYALASGLPSLHSLTFYRVVHMSSWRTDGSAGRGPAELSGMGSLMRLILVRCSMDPVFVERLRAKAAAAGRQLQVVRIYGVSEMWAVCQSVPFLSNGSHGKAAAGVGYFPRVSSV